MLMTEPELLSTVGAELHRFSASGTQATPSHTKHTRQSVHRSRFGFLKMGASRCSGTEDLVHPLGECTVLNSLMALLDWLR